MKSIIAENDPRQSMAPPSAKDFVGLVTKWTFEPMSVTIAYLMVRKKLRMNDYCSRFPLFEPIL